MILSTVATAAFVLAPRIADGRVVYAAEPDKPLTFGYQMSWLAIRTRHAARVVEQLGLHEQVEANWNNGLGTVYNEADAESAVFVTPPVNGWTFVVGLALPQPLGKAFIDKTTPLLLELGSEFIEVQYFLAYPTLDCFAWARVIDGKLVRAYAINDEGVVWNKGKPGKEERTLGVKLYEVRGARKRRGDAEGELILYPTEQHVMALAAKWSLDPTKIETMQGIGPAQGVVGRAPLSWKPARLRRTA
ncbi:MAG: hypothetical protein AB7O57_11210 [Hyphomicrobiaceae bacterium]